MDLAVAAGRDHGLPRLLAALGGAADEVHLGAAPRQVLRHLVRVRVRVGVRVGVGVGVRVRVRVRVRVPASCTPKMSSDGWRRSRAHSET